jgi:iduronate 2-sulfatase
MKQLLLFTVLCHSLLDQGSPAADAARPNILFVNADDFRTHSGVFTRELVKTPHLDRLAARAVTFERAYVQYTVCNPSRSSYLTGLRCEQTGILDNLTLLRQRLPDVVTLPQLFKEAGWHTESFGKIFHIAGGKSAKVEAALDLPKSWHAATLFKPTARGQQMIERRDMSGGELRWCWWGMAEGGDEDQPDGQIAAATIAAIERHLAGPWFIGCGFMKPHDPFVAPKKYFDLYPLDTMPVWQDAPDLTPVGKLAGVGKTFASFTDRERRENLRAYCAGVSFMDAQLGRVLDVLDRHDLWKKTIVVFLGDHGYHHGERGWWNKNTLFERTCRAPLLLAAPGVRGGQRTQALVEFIDLLPTLAALAGLTPPAGLPGTSLQAILTDPAASVKDAAFSLITRSPGQYGRRIRTPRWAFTQWSDGSHELYDHDADPEEQRDLAARQRKVVQDLTTRLAQLPPVPATEKPAHK